MSLKTDWNEYDVMKPEDLNALAGAVNGLEEECAAKVTGSWRIYSSLEELGLAHGQETILDIVGAMPYRSSLIYHTGPESNTGIYPVVYGTITITRYGLNRTRVMFTSAGDGTTMWIGNFYDANDERPNTWSGWARLATAEPPEIHELKLLNGFTGLDDHCYYFKTQENIVTITFRCGLNSGAIATDAYTIAHLPAGFRPKRTTHTAGVSYPTAQVPLLVWIGVDGALRVRNLVEIPKSDSDSFASFCGTITYIAED